MTTSVSKNYHNCAVVVPTYNERDTITRTLKQILASLTGCHILVVDDNSPDGTSNKVRRFASRNVTLLKRSGKGGRGSAVQYGMRTAYARKRYQFFIEMDADYSHDPHELPLLVEVCSPKTIAVGSRYVAGSTIKGWPWKRKALSALANLLIRLVLQLPLHDATNGFRCYSRGAASLLLTHHMVSSGFVMLSESAYLLDHNGYQFKEIPSRFVNRKKGTSNATFGEFLRSFIALLQIRTAHR